MKRPDQRTMTREGRRLLAPVAAILAAGCLTGSLLGAAVPLGEPRGAAEVLGRAEAIPQEQDVGELIRELAAADARERAMAACRIGRLSSRDVRRATSALIELLGDAAPVEGRLCRREGRWRNGWEDSSPGREAAIALEEAGSAAVEPVLGVLLDSDPRRREHAALALGLLEDRRAVEDLARLLRDDADAPVRARSAWGLGMIEHPDGVPALGRAVRSDADVEVRERAAWALGMIEHPDGVPALGDALGDVDFEVRAQAAWALGMIESPSGVDPLVSVLADSEREVREQAAWALGMIEDPSATAALVDALRDDDPEVRKQVAWALGMIEDPSAADALVDALDDEDPEVREQAMWALTMVMDEASFGDIDPHELAEKLRRALRDDGAR